MIVLQCVYCNVACSFVNFLYGDNSTLKPFYEVKEEGSETVMFPEESIFYLIFVLIQMSKYLYYH